MMTFICSTCLEKKEYWIGSRLIDIPEKCSVCGETKTKGELAEEVTDIEKEIFENYEERIKQ